MNHSKMINTFSSMHSFYLRFLCMIHLRSLREAIGSFHPTLHPHRVTSFTFTCRLYANDLIHLQICISNHLLAISFWMCPTTPQNKSDHLCFSPPPPNLPFKNKNKIYFTIFSILINGISTMTAL